MEKANELKKVLTLAWNIPLKIPVQQKENVGAKKEIKKRKKGQWVKNSTTLKWHSQTLNWMVFFLQVSRDEEVHEVIRRNGGVSKVPHNSCGCVHCSMMEMKDLDREHMPAYLDSWFCGLSCIDSECRNGKLSLNWPIVKINRQASYGKCCQFVSSVMTVCQHVWKKRRRKWHAETMIRGEEDWNEKDEMPQIVRFGKMQ